MGRLNWRNNREQSIFHPTFGKNQCSLYVQRGSFPYIFFLFLHNTINFEQFFLMTRVPGLDRFFRLFIYKSFVHKHQPVMVLFGRYSNQIFKFLANFHFCFFILPQYRHFPPLLIHCSLQKQTLKYLPIFGCKIDFSTCQMIIVPTVILWSVHWTLSK